MDFKMAQQRRTVKKVETTYKSEEDLLPGLPHEVNEIVRKLQDASKCRYQLLEKQQRKIRQKQTHGVYLALAGGIVAAIAFGVQFLFWWLAGVALIMTVAGGVVTAAAMREESNERKNTSTDLMRIYQLTNKCQSFSRRLRDVAESLNQHHRNVKKATFGGALSSFIGGVVTVLAAVLTPWTGRRMLPLAGVGMLLSGAGDLVKNGSSLVEIFIQKINGKDLQKEWDEIIGAVHTECQVLYDSSHMRTTNLQEYISLFVQGLNLLRSRNNLQNGLNMLRAAGNHQGVYNLGTTAKNVGFNKVSDGVEAIGRKEFFLTLAMLPNNFTEMLRAAVDLMDDEEPEACQVLLKLADCTEKITNELMKTSKMLRLFSDKHH